jgi:small subunit ribosomal protein S4
MKRKHKTYSRPKRPFDKTRIDEEAGIKKSFGLKNKKEIWKADAQIRTIRTRAKKLIGAEESEQKALFERLNKQGFKVESIADVLGLEKADYLNRRLQTFVVGKGLASTQKGARQLIVHKKVLVNGKVVDSPSYIVPVEFEDKIKLKPKKVKKKVEKPTDAPTVEGKESAPVEKTASEEVPSAPVEGKEESNE